MKEDKNKKNMVFVWDGSSKETTDMLQENTANKFEKLKKPIIFFLMGIVFLGCMYLIFNPSEGKKITADLGLNDSVPQASEIGLQSDKQKAYEEELLEQKNQEKQNALTSLSDYWNEENTDKTIEDVSQHDNATPNNPSLNSYRNAQNTLGTFYHNDNSETLRLQKQLDEMKEQLAKKGNEPVDPVESQLELMEKSYQMAVKYLPINSNSTEQFKQQIIPVSVSSTQKETFVAFTPNHKKVVSALYRENTDSIFLANWSQKQNRSFYTVGRTEQEVQPKNSIRAVIQEEQIVTGESSVRLRLLQPAKTANYSIPKGTIVTANAKLQQGRLQMKITSIALEGNIFPVNITVYGLDGQEGLFVPYSPEMNALTETAANMSQTSGSSIMMTRSAGQQIAGDLSRGVVQGVSGYFSKKVRTPKVRLKAGHQVFLVSKK